jgi:hypothetical protein
MGLQPAQGDEKRLGPATNLYGTIALPFLVPRARDFFDFLVFFAPNQMFSIPSGKASS